MISKPILFSGPMVRAILEGRKTQTRRVVKPQPNRELAPYPPEESTAPYWNIGGFRTLPDASNPLQVPNPVGSEMWVRETWTQDGRGTPMPNGQDGVYYRADMPEPAPWKGFWKPSIFMPRWASRITLKVTDVRVQRLQDISKEDAIAEGIMEIRDEDGLSYSFGNGRTTSARRAYHVLWNSINGDRAWDLNPWVWAYTFERVS